jgi:hypothetical protein
LALVQQTTLKCHLIKLNVYIKRDSTYELYEVFYVKLKRGFFCRLWIMCQLDWNDDIAVDSRLLLSILDFYSRLLLSTLDF